MPVVLLDNIVLEWSRQGLPAVNDVLTHYRTGGYGKIRSSLKALGIQRGVISTFALSDA